MCSAAGCIIGTVCTICCSIILVIVLFVVWLSNVKAPEVGVVELKINPVNFPQTPAPIDMQGTFWIVNDNGWPLTGKVLNATFNISSVAKNNKDSSIPIGTAYLDEAFTIGTHSNSTFKIVLKSVLEKDSALFDHLKNDCFNSDNSGTTPIAVDVWSVSLSYWKKSFDFPINYTWTHDIPCPATGAGPLPSPTPPPTAGPGPAHSKECSANPECVKDKLEGDCCPTDAGITLGCCSKGFATSSTVVV